LSEHTIPRIGVLLGGKAYTLKLQYPGDVYYPQGLWFDLPELVVNLDERQVMRYRSSTPRPTWKVSVMEMRRFSSAQDISHIIDNSTELKRLKNGKEPRNKKI
jgi:hypothetical protein